MFGLEARPGKPPERQRGGEETIARACLLLFTIWIHRRLHPSQDQMGLKEPCFPPGTSMLVQVPPRTNFQEFPWKSIVDVP
jgi:hypothetical protein